MKHILFLDIDGVLNSHRSLFSKFAEHYGIPHSAADFSKKFWNTTNGINPKLLEKIEEARDSNKFTYPNTSMYDFPFDKICIENCNVIIEQNDAEIVVISSWRTGRTIEELQILLSDEGINGRVIGKTDREETRGLEIYEWVEHFQNKYDTKIESICILDDEHAYDIDYLFGDYTTRDITSLRNGLRKNHIKESKKIFKKPFDIDNIVKS